jgi:hypothetical protein
MRARMAFKNASGRLCRALDFKTHCSSLHHLALFLAINLTARRQIRAEMKLIE